MSEIRDDMQQMLVEEVKDNGIEDQKEPQQNDYVYKEQEDLAVSRQQKGMAAINLATAPYRYFNIGSILFSTLSSLFMALFLGYLTPLLVAVYFIQIIFLVVNMVFYCVGDRRRMIWVHFRLTFVYLPFLIMIALFMYDLYVFFEKLDAYHMKYALIPHAPEAQDKLQVALITIWLINFIIMPFFQGLSFVAYAKELGYFIDIYKRQLGH